MQKSLFNIVSKTDSINIKEWKEKHPRYCAIIERDKEKDGYGWIRYRGTRPYPYSLATLSEAGDYCNDLHCNPNDCYEVVPKDYVIATKGTRLSPERQKEILKAMNQ